MEDINFGRVGEAVGDIVPGTLGNLCLEVRNSRVKFADCHQRPRIFIATSGDVRTATIDPESAGLSEGKAASYLSASVPKRGCPRSVYLVGCVFQGTTSMGHFVLGYVHGADPYLMRA